MNITIKQTYETLLILLINTFIWTSCSTDEVSVITQDTRNNLRIEEMYGFIGKMHSASLNDFKEILADARTSSSKDLTEAEINQIASTSIRGIVKKQIEMKQGRALTSTETQTLNSVLDYHERNFSARIKKMSQSDLSNPASFRDLYALIHVSTNAQQCLNTIFAAIETGNKSNVDRVLQTSLNQVRSGSYSNKEKEYLMSVINITQDSANYWDKGFTGPQTRGFWSRMIKSVVAGDAIGAAFGFVKGIYAGSTTGLIFGPGGTVLTIAGSVLVSAVEGSVSSAIAAGII